MLLPLTQGWALLADVPDGEAFAANIFPGSCRSGGVTSPTAQGQRPPLLAAGQAAQGTECGAWSSC